MNVCLSARTDVGIVRDHNEDNFSIVQSVSPFLPWDYQPGGFDNPENGLLLLVADGMGGTNAGEVASSLAVNVVEDSFKELDKIPASVKAKEDFLKGIIHKAKKLIVNEAKANSEYRGMGTTVVIAWIIGQQCHLAWAGDSRAYLLNKDQKIEIISKDHSLVWELMEKGMLTEEEAETHPDSNIITQSLSDSGAKLKPDSRTIELSDGDKLLLCSDGLNGMVDKEGIRKILVENRGNDACTKLVEEANLHGGTDNITVVLMETSPFWSEDIIVAPVEEEREIITEKTIKLVNEGWTEKNPDLGLKIDIVDKGEAKDKQPGRPEQKEVVDSKDRSEEVSVENPSKGNGGFLKKLWSKIIGSNAEEEESADIERHGKEKVVVELKVELKVEDEVENDIMVEATIKVEEKTEDKPHVSDNKDEIQMINEDHVKENDNIQQNEKQ